VLRSTFALKGNEVVKGWRKLHNKELLNLYSSTNIIRMINSRKMRRSAHVACMDETKQCLKDFSRDVKRKEIILKS
jgi:hypothetical protein